jgi:hypothetical protein
MGRLYGQKMSSSRDLLTCALGGRRSKYARLLPLSSGAILGVPDVQAQGERALCLNINNQNHSE